jgi:lipopolysaccharide transport system permease protein
VAPLSTVRDMLTDLWAARELAWRLFVRDINAQCRTSFIGVLWKFVPPIITAIGFTLAKETKIFNVGATEIPYPAYVMLSMVLWQTFQEAMQAPLKALQNSKSILGRINFPREALILAKISEVIFNFGIKMILIVGIFVYFNLTVTSAVLLAPLGVLSLLVLGLCFGILLAPLSLISDDIGRTVTAVQSFWIFLTPIVYPLPHSGLFATVVGLNPVTPLLMTTREFATGVTISDPVGFIVVSIAATLGLCLSWLVFRLSMPRVIERLGT